MRRGWFLVFLVLLSVTSAFAHDASQMPTGASPPDWSLWECKDPEADPSGFIEQQDCRNPGSKKFDRAIYRMAGSPKPFMLLIGYDESAKNPMVNAQLILEVEDGVWVTGMRGKEFFAVENPRGVFHFSIKISGGKIARRTVRPIY